MQKGPGHGGRGNFRKGLNIDKLLSRQLTDQAHGNHRQNAGGNHHIRLFLPENPQTSEGVPQLPQVRNRLHPIYLVQIVGFLPRDFRPIGGFFRHHKAGIFLHQRPHHPNLLEMSSGGGHEAELRRFMCLFHVLSSLFPFAKRIWHFQNHAIIPPFCARVNSFLPGLPHRFPRMANLPKIIPQSRKEYKCTSRVRAFHFPFFVIY